MEDDITASPQASQNRKAKGRRQKDSQRNPVCRDNRMQVDWDVTKVRLQINCAPQTAELAATWNMEEYPLRCSQISPQIRQDAAAKNCRFVISSGQKRGSVIGYNGFNRISGTKIHVAVEQNGLPVSVVMGPANQHDSARFVDVMDGISQYLDERSIRKIARCQADKGYDAEFIRKYLTKRKISDCIPYRKNSKTQQQNDNTEQYLYGKTRYVVERFFAWLKNGFHRTRIRYEKNAQNYLAFVIISSIMMYWRVLG